MKKDYNKTKKLVIMGLAVVAVCLFVGVCIYLSKMGKPEPVEAEPTETVTETTEISVPEIVVPEATEEQPVTEQIHDTEMQSEPETEADTITPGQDNTSKSEAEAPVEKLEVSNEEALTNPEQEPQYEAEVTQPQTQPEQPQGGSTNEAGQVYVPGFGYIDDPGQAQGGVADSDGDWDKQIGDMN